MSDFSKAVFLSYASQDAEAARRIAEALRASGIEVWFDQNELVGGDQWDAKIRGQIGSCALFVPIISAATQARLEGYFRREWKQAAARTQDMADEKAFLLPVVIDGTRDAEAKVPAEFKSVQWTKLPGGETPPAFCARVKKLLSEEQGAGSKEHEIGADRGQRTQSLKARTESRRLGRWWWVLPIFGVMMALVLVLKESRTEPLTVKPAPAAAAPSEARQLVAKAWEQMIKPEMARVELDAADNLCKRAAELDPNDAEVWAAWSQVDSWYVYHRLESTPARREGARKKAALALSLSAQSYEARLAQACYLMREGGGQSATQYTADAEAGLRALLQERPDEPRALLSLGILQRNLGQVAAFRDSFGRMARSPAFAVQAYNELGWAEYFLGNFREAEAAIDASIKLHPYWANLNLKTYLLLCWWGDLDRAKLTADQIPVSGSQENYGLSVHLQVNQWRRDPPAMLRVINSVSRDWLQSNAADGPKAWWTGLAQQMTGQAEVAQLQWGIALKVVEQRLGDQPDSSHLLDWKGRLLLALGRRAEGESSLRLAHAMGFKGYFDDDALSLILMGKEDAAIALLESRVEEREVFLTAATLRLHPYFDPLRALPRYQALQAKLDADPRFSPKAKAANRKPEDREQTSHGPGRATGPGSAAADNGKTAVVADDKSVAVLAFANLSDDKSNEYFSDGISEELLNVLSKVQGLKVSARTSAFYFKGKEVPIPEIAKQLGVAYVIEGSVRKQGDKVRITAQLIKAADGFHVWSDTFTRDLKDIFAVQDEIAGLIARQLQLKMSGTGGSTTVDPAIYEILLQARALAFRESNVDWKQAIGLYRRALEREPRLTVAWAEMARTYVQLGRFSGMPLADAMREARVAAQRALDLEPDQATGLLALGWVQRTADWDWRGARRSFERALELEPGNASTMGDLAVFYFNTGRVTEALSLAGRAVERDPLNARAQASLGFILNLNGNWAESLVPLAKAVELAPAIEEVRSHQAWASGALGRKEEATQAAEQEPNEAYRLAAHAYLSRREAEPALAEFIAKYGEKMPGYVAMIYAIRGDAEPAFAWLDRAMIRRDASVAWVKTNNNMRSLHSDPRWDALLHKMGLADDQLK